MKRILLSLIVVIIFTKLNYVVAQNCNNYFLIEKGKKIEMQNFNHKDKLQGTTIQTVVSNEANADGFVATMQTQSLDEKGKELANGTFTYTCNKGVFYVDMRNMIDAKTMSAYKDMEMKIEGNNLEMPSTLTVGQSLKDANMSVIISNQGFKMMSIDIKITNRKVEAQESITTPAGTFNCMKITYNVATKMMFSFDTNVTEWIAPNVGTVKNETYDSKGKKLGYSILNSIK